MDRDVSAFIEGWLSPEVGGDPERIRRGYRQASPALQERLRQTLAQILTDRDVSVDDFWNPTWIVDNDEEFYQQLQKAYDILFASNNG